jgi:hypothetical protein
VSIKKLLPKEERKEKVKLMQKSRSVFTSKGTLLL